MRNHAERTNLITVHSRDDLIDCCLRRRRRIHRRRRQRQDLKEAASGSTGIGVTATAAASGGRQHQFTRSEGAPFTATIGGAPSSAVGADSTMAREAYQRRGRGEEGATVKAESAGAEAAAGSRFVNDAGGEGEANVAVPAEVAAVRGGVAAGSDFFFEPRNSDDAGDGGGPAAAGGGGVGGRTAVNSAACGCCCRC